MAASSSEMAWVVVVSVSVMAVRLATWKSSWSPGRRRCLRRSSAVISSVTGSSASADRDADRDGADRAAEEIALEQAQRGGQRHDDDIVAVLAAKALPALFHDADDGEAYTLDAHHLAERIIGAEQLVGDRLADDGDARARAFLALGEDAAVAGIPFVDAEIGRDRAGDVGRPVCRARDGLRRDLGGGGGGDDIVEPGDGIGIGDAQRGAGAGAAEDAALPPGAGGDDEHVGAKPGDRIADLFLHAAADGEHQDDRGHADDHAEHGQDRAQPVGDERAPRLGEHGGDHSATSACPYSAASFGGPS